MLKRFTKNKTDYILKMSGDIKKFNYAYRRIVLKLTDFSADTRHLERFPTVTTIIK